MRYRLLCVDKLRDPAIAAVVDDFARRLQRYDKLDVVEIRASPGTDRARAIADETNAVMRAIEPGEHVWLLERTGTELSSEGLAQRLAALAASGYSDLTLVIAGAYGAGGALRDRAEFLWSLSALTLLHEWARALVVEQLYRAAKIQRGEPYHW